MKNKKKIKKKIGKREQQTGKRKKKEPVHCKRVRNSLLHVRNPDPWLKHKILKWTPYGFYIADFLLGIKYKIIH